MRGTFTPRERMASGLLVIALLMGAGYHLEVDVKGWVVGLFAWLEGLGIWAPVIFIILDLLVVVLVLPGVFLTVGAGFLFGFAQGTVYVLVGTVSGAVIAFAIARHLFGEGAARYVLSHPRLQVIDAEMARQGWKAVLVTRLIPFFPFKLSNYLFGLTEFRLRDFFLGTLLGIVPYTLTNVYAGSVVADLATLDAGRMISSGMWLVYATGLALAIGGLAYLGRVARRALDRYPLGDRPGGSGRPGGATAPASDRRMRTGGSCG